MTTEERMELGTKFKGEMNCCQAVIKAFADTVDVDESTLMRLASGFGSGMGTMEGTCGTLVGAIMIASLRSGNAPAAARARQIMPRFKELCGATICRDLKGMDIGKVLCSCEDCVRNAVRATEERWVHGNLLLALYPPRQVPTSRFTSTRAISYTCPHT